MLVIPLPCQHFTFHFLISYYSFQGLVQSLIMLRKWAFSVNAPKTIYIVIWLLDSSGGSRISLMRTPTSEKYFQKHYLAIVFRKLHEIKRNWTERGAGMCPPGSANDQWPFQEKYFVIQNTIQNPNNTLLHHHKNCIVDQWWIRNFFNGHANLRGVPNLSFGSLFPKTAWNFKILAPGEGEHTSQEPSPPWIRQWTVQYLHLTDFPKTKRKWN